MGLGCKDLAYGLGLMYMLCCKSNYDLTLKVTTGCMGRIQNHYNYKLRHSDYIIIIIQNYVHMDFE